MSSKERSSASFISGLLRRSTDKRRARPKSCNVDLPNSPDTTLEPVPSGFWKSKLSVIKRSKSQTNVNRNEKRDEDAGKRISMGYLEEDVEWEPFVRRDMPHFKALDASLIYITPASAGPAASGNDHGFHNAFDHGCVVAERPTDVMNSHAKGNNTRLASLISHSEHQSAEEGPTKTAADTSKATAISCQVGKVAQGAASANQTKRTWHYGVKESTVTKLNRERTPPENTQPGEGLDDVESPEDVHQDILALCEKYSPVTTDAVKPAIITALAPSKESKTSRDSGFQEKRQQHQIDQHDKMEPTQDPFAASLSFPSEESEEESDSFYGKVVVRKSRSYHDLVRKRSRSKSRSSQMESSGGSHDSKWRLMRSYDSSSTGISELQTPQIRAQGLVVSDRSRKQRIPMESTPLRRAGSLDSVSTRGPGAKRKESSLQRRSMVVNDSLDYEAICVQPKRTGMGRHSKSLGNVATGARKNKQKAKGGKSSTTHSLLASPVFIAP